MEFLKKNNENKTKEKNSFFLYGKHKKRTVRAGIRFLEIERVISL